MPTGAFPALHPAGAPEGLADRQERKHVPPLPQWGPVDGWQGQKWLLAVLPAREFVTPIQAPEERLAVGKDLMAHNNIWKTFFETPGERKLNIISC